MYSRAGFSLIYTQALADDAHLEGLLTMIKEIGPFLFHTQQRERFKSGHLLREWAKQYPEIFEKRDVEIAQNQESYHFYEWLAAILLFHSTGYRSLVEKYEFEGHPEKREVLRKLVSPDLLKLITDHEDSFGRVQCPDLLVYAPDLSDWFFCEVKGSTDSVSEEQEQFFKALAQASGKPVYVLEFQEV